MAVNEQEGLEQGEGSAAPSRDSVGTQRHLRNPFFPVMTNLELYSFIHNMYLPWITKLVKSNLVTNK